MADLETIGSHQEIHVGEWKCDRRGLLSGSVQRHIREPFDKVDLKLLSVNAAPAMNVSCVGATRSYTSPHGIYTYSYEGIGPDHDEDDERLVTMELDITVEEVSIEAHPNLANIEAKYGRFDPVLKRFTRKFISVNGGPVKEGSKEGQKINPLFGTDSYMSFGATFKRSSTRRTIPANALRNIGGIVTRPRGLSRFPLPAAAKHRKWLKVAPRITLRGNCVTLDENWIMSGRHGIVQEIYGTLQLEEEPDSGASGGGSSITGR